MLDLIPPPAGAIGAPGLRLSGGVRGAGTLPRTMGRTPSPGFTQDEPGGAIVEGDSEPVSPAAVQGAEAYL